MKQDFLFEIGTEELPPKALPQLAAAFQDQVLAALQAQDLHHGKVKLYYTPRRIALLILQLDHRQPKQRIVRKGPALKAAYDANGKPTKAMQGFLTACQTQIEAIEVEYSDKGEWVVYRTQKTGELTIKLLPHICEQALQKLPVPKMMRWGDKPFEFVRPVHWVLMLFGQKVVKANLFGHVTNKLSYGHRFHHPDAIEISQPSDYAVILRQTGKVVVDPHQRQQMIKRQIDKRALSINAQVILIDKLLAEVNNMVEWPVAILCQFNEAFINIPKEILISSMQAHQKSFAVSDKNGALMPYFISVSNLKSKRPQWVVSGNEKVMSARLSDAKFFYEQDCKTPLQQHFKQLDSVMFQQQLGSVADKVQHMQKLALQMAKDIQIDTAQLKQAIALCKCDLMTEVVMEFPELQGVMGKYYAHDTGVDNSIAEAIEDHYKPRFAGDTLARSDLGNIIAIADKMTTLVGIFGIGKKPTGTKDPFKLRRAAIGLLHIIIENGYTLDLKKLLTLTAKAFGACLTVKNVVVMVFEYILERLRVWYHDQGVPRSVIEAVLTYDSVHVDLYDIDRRIRAVQAFSQLPAATALCAANKRVFNILTKSAQTKPLPAVKTALLTAPAEQDLSSAIDDKLAECEPLWQDRDYQQYLTRLATLREPVDTFFDHVLVMTDDQAIRQNRLALLQHLRQLFCRVADVSKL